jgi:hypothetical protein
MFRQAQQGAADFFAVVFADQGGGLEREAHDAEIIAVVDLILK